MRTLLILIGVLVLAKGLLLLLASCTADLHNQEPAGFGAGFRMDEAAAAAGG